MTSDALGHPNPSRHVVPARAQTFGMWLFLAALVVLFAASMLLYVLARTLPQSRPAFGVLTLPGELWVSTMLVLAASGTIHLALQSVRRERQTAFRRWMLFTSGLAVAFCLIQTPALLTLLRDHARFAETGVRLYGLVFVLILLHALHVVGGVIYLGYVTTRGWLGRYDHEAHVGVRHAALYWHLLDGVWVWMFATLLIFR